MSNRVGYIFHEDFKYFSPLLYVSNGGSGSQDSLQRFIRHYLKEHKGDKSSGRLFSADATFYDFLIYLGNEPMSCRLENLSDAEISSIQECHEFKNCYDSGCYIVNVSYESFGNIDGDGRDISDYAEE